MSGTWLASQGQDYGSTRHLPTIPSGDEEDSHLMTEVLSSQSLGHALDEGFDNDEEGTVFVQQQQHGSRSTKNKILYSIVVVLTVILFSVMAVASTQFGKSAFDNALSLLTTPTDSTMPSSKLTQDANGLQVNPSGDSVDGESDTAAPTMFPTDVAPTRFPTVTAIESILEEDSTSTTTTTTTTSHKAVLPFSIYRDGYSILDYFSQSPSEVIKYKFLDGYHGVVEPYADMYPYIFAAEEASESGDDTYYYTYTVCKEGDDETSTDCTTEHAYSESFSKACTPLEDTYTLTVYQYETATQAKTGSLQAGAIICVYVRREMRALTSADLTKTMDAMWKMWELEEDEGQALYGENFRNFAYLLEYHYFNAAWQDADHIHEGNGFLTQHVKMDGIFETSMQAVDPSISLPYWDFTIENATGLSVWESPLFTADTFGTLGMPKDEVAGWSYSNDLVEDGAILDGRWANFRADKNEKYPDLLSAYGYMRAPWNMNPANVITRYTSMDKQLPTCQSHHELLSYTLLTDFLKQVPYDAHASTHGVLGGVYGCDAFDPLLEAGYINDEDGKLNLCKNWIFYLKEFYRDNIVVPNSNCSSVDSTGAYSSLYENQKCGFTCVPDMLNILILQLERSVLNSDYACVPTVDEMPAEGWVAWREFICEGDGFKIFGGDHLESASPADPSFWPIHPTLERLLQVRLMAGGFESMDWPTDPVNDYVCNKATCYDPFYASNDDTRAGFGSWENCCYGHFIDDQILDAPNGDRFTAVGPTNRDIMEWTDPTSESYGMPYVYDGFDWSHCVDTGYDINSLLSELYYGNVSVANTTQVVITDDLNEKGWRVRDRKLSSSSSSISNKRDKTKLVLL
jgi:hypothetical protein